MKRYCKISGHGFSYLIVDFNPRQVNIVRLLILFVMFSVPAGCGPERTGSHTDSESASNNLSVKKQIETADHFQGINGTFVLFDSGADSTVVVHNPERAQIRFLPASTYKIPNTLIALETGVADGPDFTLARDSSLAPEQDWWPEAWARDHHTLRTALPNSVVWYYQELARRIGAEQMQQFVNRLEYGNRDISGEIDLFWLTGGLRISAEEQVGFLKRFYFGELDISERNAAVTRDLLVIEETPGYRLSGKTGWVMPVDPSEPQIGWFVGYLERGENVCFFALNIDIEEDEDAAMRIPIVKNILHDLGLMEKN